MDNIDFKQKLTESLLSLPGSKENSTHCILLCPNCELHRDRNKHGHLYISKDKEGFPGDCKKCDLSFAKINVDILNKLGITDSSISSYVKMNYKRIQSHVVSLDERSKRLNYKLLHDLSRFDKIKLSILSDRLLHDLDNEEDIKTYRIVGNLSSFINENHIDMSSYDAKKLSMIPIIDRYYCGFLSYFGNIISFRNITGDDKYPRYLTFILSDLIQRSFFYTPASLIDPLADNPKITVSEGAIDTISLHLTNSCYDNNNHMYAAASSMGSMRSCIKTCLYITGFYGADINVYIDNDELVKRVSHFDFGKISHALKDFTSDFKLTGYINTSGKDFGDLREKITIGKTILNNIEN